jgi:hypothetical protein
MFSRFFSRKFVSEFYFKSMTIFPITSQKHTYLLWVTNWRQDIKHLGRWNITYDSNIVNKKIDLSNNDHCGTCSITDVSSALPPTLTTQKDKHSFAKRSDITSLQKQFFSRH